MGTTLPDLNNPNQGFDEESIPIFYGFRWTHWPATHEFDIVAEVLDYHNTHVEVINALENDAPTLVVYFYGEKMNFSHAEVFIRYERDGSIISEPITHHNPIETDPFDPGLKRITGIRFATRDQGDGKPYYDFSSMSGEGIYECWIRAYDKDGNHLSLRIPFSFENLPSTGGSGSNGDGDSGDGGSGDSDNGDNDNGDSGSGENGSDDSGSGDNGSDEGNGDTGGDGGSEESTKNRVSATYYLTLIEGASPFTKRPTTHFRPAGVGVLKDLGCIPRLETTASPKSIYYSTFEPIVGIPNVPNCMLSVSPNQVQGVPGEVVEFYFDHSNDSGVFNITAVFDRYLLDQLSDTEFLLKNVGNTEIKFVVDYNNGQQCESTVSVNIQEEV